MTAPKATGHTATIKGELNWLLDDLVDRVASIRKALVLSGGGFARWGCPGT
ncbi:dynein regulation protein LC7 [Streptomyces purpurascens]